MERKNVQSKSAQVSRYCSQNEFVVLNLGGRRTLPVEDIKYLDASSLNIVRKVRSTLKDRRLFSTACLKGEIYVFGGSNSDSKHIMSVDKFIH